MRKLRRGVLSLILILALLLGGCNLEGIVKDFMDAIQEGLTVPFSEMEYTRPDPAAFPGLAEEIIRLSQEETGVEALMDRVYAAYDSYYSYYTNYMLAYIHYCSDMTDIYWEQEYNACLEPAADIDAALDQMLYALADSPLREALEAEEYFGQGFFDDYQGESLWDETFTALMEEESELIMRYYDLSAQSMADADYSDQFFETWGVQLSELFVELVAQRQRIAQYAGYDSYVDFAYDFYYYRDYTPEQAVALMADIQREMVPLYTDIPDSVWSPGYQSCTQEESLGYVEAFAAEMGGTIADACQLMVNNGLYNNTVSPNKYDASFETYLYSYYCPYIFLNPTGTARDRLTFAHEFGHFCNDYASGGSGVSVDVAEVFSQGMEYLSLRYHRDGEALTAMQMASSLSVFVEQSAYASFEHQVYELKGDALTVENVQALYGSIGEAYGFTSWGWDSRDYCMIPHFFTNPVYIISYVVSNTAAMQLYQAELETEGKGLEMLEKSLSTQQVCFVAFARETGLRDPFSGDVIPGLADIIAQGMGK